MRYLIQPCFIKELSARKKYLYASLKLWFFKAATTDNSVCLKSFPDTCYKDWMVIVGHNYYVREYLTSHNITESNIVAITCDGGCNFKQMRIPGKKLFIPIQNSENLVEILSGSEFGFDFDLTESELLFYNSPQTWSIDKRIEMSFIPIEKYRRS